MNLLLYSTFLLIVLTFKFIDINQPHSTIHPVNNQVFHQITNLTYNHPWFSGFLQANYTPQSYTNYTLFYFWFFYSQSHLDDPVILWLNGGPGCSSISGALEEHGPFMFDKDTQKMFINKYSWNQKAHVLYLESPVGVGYSRGPDTSNNDTATMNYNLQALINFFTLFPQLRKNKFFIAGESYAGIYIPMLASAILDWNKNNLEGQRINLEGILLGNGCIHPKECKTEQFIDNRQNTFSKFQFETYRDHGFINQDLFDRINQNYDQCTNLSTSEFCFNLITEVTNSVSYFIHMDPYNMFDYCLQGNDTESQQCENDSATNPFMFNINVAQMLNIPKQLIGDWRICPDVNYTSDVGFSWQYFPQLIQAKVRILVYYGNVDSVVPITGAFYWLDEFQKQEDMKVKKDWSAWLCENSEGKIEFCGNVYELEKIQLVSVHNSGHMVPMDQPSRAFIMMDNFINDIEF